MRVSEIVKGPFFPESIEIKKVEEFDKEYVLIEGIGRQTNEYYERIFTNEELNKLEYVSTNFNTNTKLNGKDIQYNLLYMAVEIEDKHSKRRALGNKQVIPLPHQIEAVYSRMLQTPSVRYLLADDPGAGKTIMSGMLIKELKARERAQRILVLVPPLVLRQWQEEMEQKFQESFKIINRAVLNEYGSANPFIENDCCLASIHWSIREDVKALILEAQFDLVIVDEAHKMAAYSYGKVKPKTSKTKLYSLGEKLLAKTEHCLLLTATPHKGDAENFRLLMKLIEPDLFGNISAGENLKVKSNPYIIRRLKESMVNFDNTPIFPKRTTKTIQYGLTDDEIELYEAVTKYVQEHFNRAVNAGHNSTAFAMMLLQRRLSSSIEAIYKSLMRRYKRLKNLLDKTENERKKYTAQLEKYYSNSLEEELNDHEETIEQKLELAFDEIDVEELKIEMRELQQLIIMAKNIKSYGLERKYLELEEMLFGINGLIYSGEKIIIFTESVDTLNALEEKLAKRVDLIAKIIGKFSMDERHKQVELFRNSAQIMLATDAGGESINLQFCNQMINYDIPWNPNRLEQRMGRIHRIGQKNEVFIFNLVASNTREGYVMGRLLDKLEMMKQDLGDNLVYNFMGELLDGEENLADLMKEAILNREHLEDVIQQMDKKLTSEHQELLNTMKKMQLNEEAIDVVKMKKEQYEVELNKIPTRTFTSLSNYIFEKNNIKIFNTSDHKIYRIERFPKLVRDQYFKKYNLQDSYRYTGFEESSVNEVKLITKEHPLFNLSSALLHQVKDQIAFKRYIISYNIPEKLEITIYRLSLKDGTGKELKNRLVSLAKRKNGEIIRLNPYWMTLGKFPKDIVELDQNETSTMKREILNVTIHEKEKAEKHRESQINKIHDYLVNSFESQSNAIYDKLIQYQNDNIDNRNSILINQMNAQLIDIQNQKNKRIELLNRQRTISVLPPKMIAQFEMIPNGMSTRVIADDYLDLINNYERSHGRKIMMQFDNLGLVDFYSERFNGEERFIILVSTEDQVLFSEEAIEDLKNIKDKVYIYSVANNQIIESKLTLA